MLKFGYWNIRGLAQPIRLLLEYVKVNYEEKLYDYKNSKEWYDEKHTLGLSFPNLPYLIDGENKLTQSSVILQYLGEKYGLAGDNQTEAIQIAICEQTIKDLRLLLIKIVFKDDFPKLRDEYCQILAKGLRDISNFLGTKKFIVGDKISYADFTLYENLDVFLWLDKNCLKDHQNLCEYKTLFEALPNIKDYIQSARFIKWPIHGFDAKFGGGDSPPI